MGRDADEASMCDSHRQCWASRTPKLGVPVEGFWALCSCSGLWDQGVSPHLCDTRESPFYYQNSLWEALSVVSQKRSFPTALLLLDCSYFLAAMAHWPSGLTWGYGPLQSWRWVHRSWASCCKLQTAMWNWHRRLLRWARPPSSLNGGGVAK